MKLYKYLLLSVFFLLFSCDEFLTEEPKILLSENQFFENERDFSTALTSTYSELHDLYDANYSRLTSAGSDEADEGNFGDITEFLAHTYGPANSEFESWWTNNYSGINQANSIIANGEGFSAGTPSEVELVARYVAEAKFLRALYYFNLVLAFGDVPFTTEPTSGLDNLNIGRTATSAIYTQIEQDLMDAETVLPDSYDDSSVGRVTSGAASALLAKVYLFQQKWQEARDKAAAIITSGRYNLVSDYLAVTANFGKNSEEHIFSVQYERGSISENDQARVFGVNAANDAAIVPDEISGQSGIGVAPDFFNDFPEGYRRDVSLFDRIVPSIDGGTIDILVYHTIKYFDTTKEGNDEARGDNNFNILRYADVLLMFAEADNEVNGPTNEAVQYVNQIRRRAAIQDADINAPNPSVDVELAGLTQDEFRDIILDERKWELAFEGHRRWDLIRTGRYLDEVPAATNTNLLYPIPLREIDLNTDLNQNPGY